MSAARLRRQRALAQALHRPADLGPAGVVQRLLAVQAQDLRSARRALRARTQSWPTPATAWSSCGRARRPTPPRIGPRLLASFDPLLLGWGSGATSSWPPSTSGRTSRGTGCCPP